MTDKLPPTLLQLFSPRPPLRYVPPGDHEPGTRRTARITGVAQYLPALKAKAAKAQAVAEGQPVDPEDLEPETAPTQSILEARDLVKAKKQEHQKWLMTEGFKQQWNPHEDPNVKDKDPLKTLFVSRLPYDVTVRELEQIFGRYGKIDRARIVTDHGHEAKRKGKISKTLMEKSRGYAFIVFESERAMIGMLHPAALLQSDVSHCAS